MNDERKPTKQETYRALNAANGKCIRCPRAAKIKRGGRFARFCKLHLRRDRLRKRKAKDKQP